MISFARKHITVATACASMAVSLLVITGWLTAARPPTRLFFDKVPVNLNTAICIFLFGVALLLVHKQRFPRLVQLICAFVFLIGSLSLLWLLELTTINPNLWFFSARMNPLATQGGPRMSMPAGISFTLLAPVLLLLPYPKTHRYLLGVLYIVLSLAVLVFLNNISGIVFLKKHTSFLGSSAGASLLFMLLVAGTYYSSSFTDYSQQFRIRIAGLLGFVLLVLAFFFIALRNDNEYNANLDRQITKADHMFAGLGSLQLNMEVLQQKLKNLLILQTGESHLDYEQAEKELQQQLTILLEENKAELHIHKTLDSLKKAVTAYALSRDSLAERSLAAPLSKAAIQQITNEGAVRMDSIRKFMFTIRMQQSDLITGLKKTKTELFNHTSRIISLSQVFTIVFLLLTFLVIYRNSVAKEKLVKEMNLQQHFLEGVITYTSNPVAIRSRTGDYMLLNKSFADLIGSHVNDMAGKNIVSVHPKEIAAVAKTADDRIIHSGKAHTEIVNTQLPSGSYIFSVNRFPILDESEAVVAVGTVATDITEISRAKLLLEEFKLFFENSFDICIIADKDGSFEQVNKMMSAVLGYPDDEVVGKSFIDFVHPDDILYIVREFERNKANRDSTINFSRRFIRKDGETIWLSWQSGYHTDSEKIFCIGRDISLQKEVEQKLKTFNDELEQKVEEKTREVLDKEQQYRFLLENMREGIQIISHDWRWLFVNDTVVQQSRYKSDRDLLGYTIFDKYPGVEHTELFRVLERCMKERVPDAFENFFEYPNGESSWFEMSVQPVSEGIFILSTDISTRKKAEAELKKHTEELRRSNTELERFAYVASHDLQEPLRMVSSFINLLSRRLDSQLDETTRQYMHYAVDGAERMKSLIHDLLEYSRIGTHRDMFTTLDPAEIMSYVLRVLETEIKATNAQVTIQSLPVIVASKNLFSQLMTNLVSNALKYHGDRQPEITIGATADADAYTFFVRDNGEGIEEKFFEKIFVIFQRLHNRGNFGGTGIGLAICKKIVEVHHGRIWVESEKGLGSTFYFTIPKKIV